MASIYDKELMSPEDYNKIVGYGENWATNPEGYHQLAELLRANYGYSGGEDGSGYTKIPLAPTMPQMTQYVSPYAKDINKALSRIDDVGSFKYNPENDPMYQAFLANAQAQSQTLYNNQLGTMAGATGGRVSSWASSAAANAQQGVMLQAQGQMPQFANFAYRQHRDKISDLYQRANMLMNLDEIEYGRHKDSVDSQWRQYEAEMNMYSQELDAKQTEIEMAMERTSMLGYVSNEDAAILGLPPGTPSEDARVREDEYQYWLKEQKDSIEMLEDRLKTEAKYKTSGGSGRSGGSSGGSTKPIPGNGKLEPDEWKIVDREKDDYLRRINNNTFMEQSEETMVMEIDGMFKAIDGHVAKGKFSKEVGDQIIIEIMNSPVVQRLYDQINTRKLEEKDEDKSTTDTTKSTTNTKEVDREKIDNILDWAFNPDRFGSM